MIPRSTYPIEIYQLNDNQRLNQQPLPSHLVFTALPHGESAKLIGQLNEKVKIVDLDLAIN